MKNTTTVSVALLPFSKAASILLIASLPATLLCSRTAESSPGVLKTPLPARCEFLHFTLGSEQPERTFVVACPSHEYFRVWPLPPEAWNRVGFKLLPKLRSAGDLRIEASVSVSLPASQVDNLKCELGYVLDELGLRGQLRLEEE